MNLYDNLTAYVAGEQTKLGQLASAHIPERGIILQVLGANSNQDKKTNLDEYSVTHQVSELLVDYMGIHGNRHHRAAGLSTGREKAFYPKETLVREHRHLFAVSPADCEELSQLLDVAVTPELLGANLVIGREDGEPYSLSALPVGTHMLVAESGAAEPSKPPIATLLRYAQQQGCGVTGNAIAAQYGDRSLTKRFVDASKRNRGIVCSVEYPVDYAAALKPGQTVFFKFSTGVTP